MPARKPHEHGQQRTDGCSRISFIAVFGLKVYGQARMSKAIDIDRVPRRQKKNTGGDCAPKDKSFLGRLGPGLVTGAADDDPSGIATYSQAGAAFGFGLLWTMVLTLPLMTAIQEISARIGRVSGHGIAGNIRKHFSPWLLYPVVFLLVATNTVNLGADIGAMGDAVHMLVGGPALVYACGFSVLSILLQVFSSYPQCSKVFKWMTLGLFSYVLTIFAVHVPWGQALKGTFLPSFSRSADYWSTMIALLGTTISPYLFFWQASQETEEINSHSDQQPLRKKPLQAPKQLARIQIDTYIGMAFSELVAYFIILASAVTLHASGITDVQTSAQAAKALEPIAGRFASVIFALGIVGTGILGIPVLATSAAYGVGEALKWPTGLSRKPLHAKGFYSVLTVATLLGLAINFPEVQKFTHLSPIKVLFWSAVINGITAAPIMVVVMVMFANKKVMGKFARGSRGLKIMGWLATLAMFLAAGGMVLTWKK
jgi:NRAMP (natural resistance-associated macrophage protein)-like metal ion transporter